LIFALQIFARHFQNLLSLGPAAQQQKRKDSSLAHEQRHGRLQVAGEGDTNQSAFFVPLSFRW